MVGGVTVENCMVIVNVDEQTKRDALNEMIRISEMRDIEIRHSLADKLVAQILRATGWAELAKVYIEMGKWYA